MSLQDFAAIATAIATVLAGVTALIRWMVKHYLMELKPNGGSSMKDQINRLETRLDNLYNLLVDKSQ